MYINFDKLASYVILPLIMIIYIINVNTSDSIIINYTLITVGLIIGSTLTFAMIYKEKKYKTGAFFIIIIFLLIIWVI